MSGDPDAPALSGPELAALARAQHPDAPRLHAALERLPAPVRRERAYACYLPPDTPEAVPIREQVHLEHPRAGTLVLDVLADGRVFGVEFLRRVR